MSQPDIKKLVVGTYAHFTHYKDSELWYRIPEHTFEFPVPISDTGSGEFPARIKAITLMRWIRKHVENLNSWRESR